MMAAGPRNFPNNLLTRLHGAFSTSVTPPRLEINRKTIEKTWKLMDKVVMINKPGHPIISLVLLEFVSEYIFQPPRFSKSCT